MLVSGSNPRVLFASYHAYLDQSSGAALSTRDLFEDLTAHGWECRVVCGPRLDYQDGRGPADALREAGIPYALERCAPAGGARYALYHYTLNGVPVAQYRPDGFDPARPVPPDEGRAFLDVLDRAFLRFRPDVVLTYGGPPVAPHLIARARAAGARVVFALHNMSYRDPGLFRGVAAVRVPSAFARDAYRRRLGVGAEVVEYPRPLGPVLAGRADGRFVTLVNPIPAKGVTWFARIAAEAARRRPDIPFLAVEGRGGVGGLRRVPLDLSAANLHGMRGTPRPREFYARTRVVLMPSLWEETFGRVAAEALANGLPVLASRHGALPETLGGAGFLFDIPARYRARPGDVPGAAEVAGWVDVIERLWGDPAFYAEHRARALERAGAWAPDRLRPGAEAFFRRVAGGPG